MTKSDFTLNIVGGLIVGLMLMGLAAYLKSFEPIIALVFAVTLAIIGLIWLVMLIKARRNKQQLSKEYTKNYSDLFGTRQKEIRSLVRRIETGQSSAIIGSFESERTSMLDYIRHEDSEQRTKHYGDKGNKLIFSYLDIATLSKKCSQAQFWQYALIALQEKMADENGLTLSKTYQACQDNQFDHFSLDKLIAQLKQENWRLVLMLDRFEELLQRPYLNRPEFFGGLRTLASSRNPSSLVLILTLNNSILQFHHKTKLLNPGSPYLNFMESGQMILGALLEKEIDSLLRQSVRQLSQEDCSFIKEKADGHPYLLHIAATTLWDAYDTGEKEAIKSAEIIFYDQVKVILNNVLHSWSANRCQAFLSLARKLDVSGFKDELYELKKQGFIKKDNHGEWQVCPRVFLDCVTDKTAQELCKK